MKFVFDLDDTLIGEVGFRETYQKPWEETKTPFLSQADLDLVKTICKDKAVIVTNSECFWLPQKLTLLQAQGVNLPYLNGRYAFPNLLKPDDSLFRYAMWYLQGTPEDTIFIGDKPQDSPLWAKHRYVLRRYITYPEGHKHYSQDPSIRKINTLEEILD